VLLDVASEVEEPVRLHRKALSVIVVADFDTGELAVRHQHGADDRADTALADCASTE